MKIARIVLTATILFSLKSTLFCSEKQTETIPTLTRTHSGIHHDGTRDGLFGNGFDTLKNIRDKKSYGKQPYGMGSDSQAPQRWGKVGQQITKLEDAQTFIAEVERLKEFGLIFTEETLQPSQTLIEDENTRLEGIRIAAEQAAQAEKIAHEAALQAKFEQADSKYLALNQHSKALLQAFYVEKNQTRKNEDKALDQKYAALLKIERTELKKARKEKDLAFQAELALAFDELAQIKKNHNEETSRMDHMIKRTPFVATKDDLNEKNLPKIAHKYSSWQAKTKTYAQAVQGEK